MAAKKDAASPEPSTKDLAKAVADATGWVQHLQRLNEAVQPFITSELNLDQLKADVEALTEKKAALEHDIMLREDHLAKVDETITLAQDQRKVRVDEDLDDYRRSIESKKRGLDADLAKIQAQIAQLDAQIPAKVSHVQALDDQIADRRRTIDQLQSDAAAIVAGLNRAAGGSSHVSQ